MPTANRLDKETNRLDGGYMSNYREEVDVDRRLMIFYQHHNSCNDKYQNAVAIRRLVEDQKTKALLDKYKETSRKDNVSLAQDKTSKPKVTIKSEQQQSTSDPPRSQKDSAADSSKEPSSLSVEHSREPIVEIDSGGTRSTAGGRSNYSVGAVVKQEEGVFLSSSCPHQTTDAVSKSSLNTTQQQQHSVMGLCDNNNSSSYNEAKTTSVSGSGRKGSISNITTNGFVGLPGKPDDELNLNAESFISENATISFLPSVDADNPDPIPVRKPTESLSKQSLPQRTSLTSNRSEDLSVHENDVEKGMDEFTKVMNQIIKREEGVSHQMRRNSSSASLCQLPDLPQLPTTSATGNNTNGSSSSPPPYPGTSSLSTSTIKQAAQQLASTKNKFQHMVANMDHVSQPPTPVGVESNWQQQQQQQQQQLLAAKQQQQMILQQQQQQHYHSPHPTKPTAMQQRKPQQQQQQYDFMKSASPNVTIVSRDPYYSATAMNMPQQQSQHAMLHQAMTINQHQPMIHLNTAPVQTMGQPTQMPQQSLATMSRNQPQIYAPLPNVDPYMGTNVDHATMTTRSGSIPYGGPIDVHMYHQQQRRHSMPPQLPTQQPQWAEATMQQQHQDLIFENFCSPAMDPHQQHTMAGQKRGQSYLPPQVAAAKRNSIQHSTVLSHTMTPAVYRHHQQQHGTLVNGELNQAFHNPINDPLMHFDNRNDLFNAPL